MLKMKSVIIAAAGILAAGCSLPTDVVPPSTSSAQRTVRLSTDATDAATSNKDTTRSKYTASGT
jgi:hypothetical protein